MKTTIIDNPKAVLQSLRDMKLSAEGMQEVIDTMVSAQRNVTENDVRGAGGTRAYQDGTCRVRDVSGAEGWIPDREGNLESMIHEGLSLRVVVCNSNPNAGLTDLPASNRNPKGPATEHVVSENLEQAEFEGLLSEVPNVVAFKPARPDGHATWYLFVWVDENTYRAELSWPISVEGGHLRNYRTRIILVRGGEDDNNLRPRTMAPDSDPALEITVTRKKA